MKSTLATLLCIVLCGPAISSPRQSMRRDASSVVLVEDYDITVESLPGSERPRVQRPDTPQGKLDMARTIAEYSAAVEKFDIPAVCKALLNEVGRQRIRYVMGTWDADGAAPTQMYANLSCPPKPFREAHILSSHLDIYLIERYTHKP